MGIKPHPLPATDSRERQESSAPMPEMFQAMKDLMAIPVPWGLIEGKTYAKTTAAFPIIMALLSREPAVTGPHPKFVSQFYKTQSTHLPGFFPQPHSAQGEVKLHTLDVIRALYFYLELNHSAQAQTICVLADRNKGQLVSFQRLPKCVYICLRIC